MVSRGGASLVQREPVFSKDGKRLLVCTSDTVTVFSVQTGEVLTVLKGHKKLVTSVVVVPVVTICHCWTAGLDGTVRLWDFASGTLLRTLEVGHPVHSMVIPELCKPRVEESKEDIIKRKPLIAFLSAVIELSNGKKPGEVFCYNLTTKKRIGGHLAMTASPRVLFVSPGGGLVGMPNYSEAWVWMVPPTIETAKSVRVTVLHHRRAMCALAFDVNETRVAAGDVSGYILVWENVGDRTFSSHGDGKGNSSFVKSKVPANDDASALTTLHWHTREVSSLVFTIDGVYLLSGGFESVLVMWQLETGKKSFLPRLGGEVMAIAPSLHPSLFAISCADNSIKLLNIGTMEMERTFQGIAPAYPIARQLALTRPCTVSIDPVDGKIVAASRNLFLQFYDGLADKSVAEVEVSVRNYVSNSRTDDGSPTTCVTHIAFSPDGSCMATVDVRIPEANVGGSTCLKFWDREPGKQGFLINTEIDELREISALSFRAGERMAVSCSNTEFKVWVPHGRGRSVSWRCRSVGSYRQRRILAAAFSPDGSILAVAASQFVTLWNPVTNSLLKVLSDATYYLDQFVTHLSFVNHSNCLLAASSGQKPTLTVWDISSLSIRWSQSLYVESLAVDPARSTFAVLATISSEGTDAVVALFDVESPKPMHYWAVRGGWAGGSLFFSKKDASKLVYLTSDREFVVFDPYQRQEETPLIKDVAAAAAPEEVSSAFTAVYGKAEAVQIKKKEGPSDVLSALSKAPWGTLLNGPVHVLPSLSVVAVPFMDSLMVKRKEQS